jgi:ketosteroid isomerase-like protein
MAASHVESLRSLYDHWSRGDFDVDAIYDPNVVFVLRPPFPDAGVHVGLDELRRYMRGFLEPWSELTITAEEFTEAGDTVIVATRQRGVGAASGIETELEYQTLWTFRGPLAIRFETVRTRPEALEAAGRA